MYQKKCIKSKYKKNNMNTLYKPNLMTTTPTFFPNQRNTLLPTIFSNDCKIYLSTPVQPSVCRPRLLDNVIKENGKNIGLIRPM